MEFRTDSIFEALKTPLGVIDNPQRREQIEAYIDTARVQLERSVFDLLSRFGEEVNGQVSAHYQVGLNYRPGALDLEVKQTEAGEAPEQSWSMAEGDVEKITLRIPAELKDLATEAASKAGLSVNSWFVRVLARAVRSAEEPPPSDTPDGEGGLRRRRRHEGGMGRRLSGWVGPE
ncbi:MAG: toxin-antitoxin system HicB family antitoxin [Dehalococcoidia bacterium]